VTALGREVWRSGAALLLLASLCWVNVAGAGQPTEVQWHAEWRRFRTAEAMLTGALLVPNAGALFVYPPPRASWHGGIWFDDAARDALVLHDHSEREHAARVSDAIYHGLAVYPPLVDDALVTWCVHGSGDVALEMLGIHLEAYARTGALALSGEALGRVRPPERGCPADPAYSSRCDSPTALNESFMSGHTAISFTSAGLICAHHGNLPLYGGGWADRTACWLALALSAGAGMLRVASDNHYTGDVLLGTGAGLASGYLLPSWLHYRGTTAQQGRALLQQWLSWLPEFRVPDSPAFHAVLAPRFASDYAGALLVGSY
jgi:membrane-associated phospholipid phosphatase